MLHSLVTFLTSREFAVNFFANLGGAMAGVLLAFWIERVKARRGARMLYGRMLHTSRSELMYLKPMCEHSRDALRAGRSSGTLDSLGVPATRALLVSPLVHDQAPHSLIMALTVLCGYLGATETVDSARTKTFVSFGNWWLFEKVYLIGTLDLNRKALVLGAEKAA